MWRDCLCGCGTVRKIQKRTNAPAFVLFSKKTCGCIFAQSGVLYHLETPWIQKEGSRNMIRYVMAA